MYRRAFTLVELLIVISIIALLASVVLASLNVAREKGRIGAGKHFAAQVEHVAEDQAVGMWDFDECSGTTTADRSGWGKTGTFTVGPTWSSNTPYSIGCSLGLAGSDYVDAGNVDLSGSSQITLAGWFYYSSGSAVVVRTNGTANTSDYGIDLLSGNVRFMLTYPNYWSSGVSIPSQKWFYLVTTFDGSKASVYVDGVLASSTAMSGPINNTSGYSLRIGKHWGAGWVGNIDAVRVYAKSLTAFEISKLYALEAPRFKLAKKNSGF